MVKKTQAGSSDVQSVRGGFVGMEWGKKKQGNTDT